MMTVYKYILTFSDGEKKFERPLELDDEKVERANRISTAEEYASVMCKTRGWTHLSTPIPLDKDDLKGLEEQQQL